MRHEFTRHCVTLGSALLLGLAASTAAAQAPASAAAPKQKALISFDSGVFTRWKRDKASEASPPAATPEPDTSNEQKALLPPNSIVARQIPAATSPAAASPAPAGSVTPLPLAVQPIATVLPPGAAPAQLTAGQLPFSQAQTPVVIMVPAGWQPDGAYTFAPRTIMSPEVPAEHWPTSQRNPFGDDSKHGLFNWPQIAKKITSESLGEQQKRAVEPTTPPTNSKALFATAAARAPSAAGASEVVPSAKPLFAPASPTAQPEETRPASKALFGPAPQVAEPEPPVEESRALFSLFTKSAKSGTAKSSTASKSTAKPLFAFGKQEDEAATAPAPEVVPQYATETPMPPAEATQSGSQPTIVGATELDEQPPAPPAVSNATPTPQPTAMMSPVKSDNPKMKWRAKGSLAKASEPSGEVAPSHEPTVVKTQATESVADPGEAVEASEEADASGAAAVESHRATVATVPPGASSGAPAPAPAVASQPVARDRSLFGNLFRTSSAAAAANELASDKDMRGPWRRQAERDAAVKEEKASERPVTDSKAILPQVAALLPALAKPDHGSHHGGTSHVATAAATEDGRRHTHAVHRAHADSARTVDSYYAPPREYSIEAELEMTERQQMHGTSSGRRAAIAQRTREPEVDARVPFETEQPAAEDHADRPAPPVAKRPTITRTNTRTSSTTARAPSTSGAKTTGQRSSKGYRRLTGDDIKKSFARPFAFFAEKTKLPPDVAEIASGSDRDEAPHSPTVLAEPGDVEVYEFYDEPEPPVVRQRSAVVRQPVYELRQTTAPAASVTDVEDSDTLRAEDEEPVDARRSQRSGRRRVESQPRTRSVLEATEHTSTDVPDELPGVATTQIRNRHGVKVLIYTGEANAGGSE